MKQQSSISNTTIETSYQNKDAYLSIDDMPIWNWNKILSTGDLKYLFINEKGRVGNKIVNLWNDLQEQYVKKFGIDANLLKEIKLKRKIANLNYDYIITKDKFNETLISIANAELNELHKNSGIDFHELLDHMEKYKGFRIDTKLTSVTSWFTTIKNMSNGKNN